jgi:1,2-phenylacetyl-CoA epoxidase catalytic subunit
MKTQKSAIKKWDIGELNMKEVKDKFIKKVTANVQNTQLEAVENINEKRNKIKKGITVAARKNRKRRGTKVIVGLMKNVK